MHNGRRLTFNFVDTHNRMGIWQLRRPENVGPGVWWRRCVEVTSDNEVAQHRAWLLLGWVTVCTLQTGKPSQNVTIGLRARGLRGLQPPESGKTILGQSLFFGQYRQQIQMKKKHFPHLLN